MEAGSEDTHKRQDEYARGQMVGGEWLNDMHPDYLWLATCPGFTGEFAELAQLYKTASGHRDVCQLNALPNEE